MAYYDGWGTGMGYRWCMWHTMMVGGLEWDIGGACGIL